MQATKPALSASLVTSSKTASAFLANLAAVYALSMVETPQPAAHATSATSTTLSVSSAKNAALGAPPAPVPLSVRPAC